MLEKEVVPFFVHYISFVRTSFTFKGFHCHKNKKPLLFAAAAFRRKDTANSIVIEGDIK